MHTYAAYHISADGTRTRTDVKSMTQYQHGDIIPFVFGASIEIDFEYTGRNTMKAFLVDVYGETAGVVDVEPTLESYYKLLDCDLIDIVSRSIGGVYYDIICDDEGLFHDPQKVSAINDMGEPMLIGNLLICLSDGNGNLVGLEDQDVVHITEHIKHLYTENYPKGYLMLTQCEY